MAETATANTVDIFNLRHQQGYALEIVARDDENKVVAVRCLFCVHLGREPAPDGALRQRSQNVRAWRTFHPINFQRHHEGQHAAHWKLYQACTPAEKDTFFEKYKKDDQVASSVGGAAAVASNTTGAEDAGLAPAKRPRGRPRSNGAASIQWSDEMAQRLLQLRFETYANWFSGESRASKHDGWKLITSMLTDEFGTMVDSEQCKNKLRLLKVHTQKQEPGASPSAGPDGSVAASRPRRAVAVPSAAIVSADDVSADAPVKRGRGRPRLNRDPNEQSSSTFVPQKKQRVFADNDASGDINTVLLKRILQATEEQKDALIAQKKAAEAQTASIQELLQFLKSRGEIPALGEKPIVPVVTSSELV